MLWPCEDDFVSQKPREIDRLVQVRNKPTMDTPPSQPLVFGRRWPGSLAEDDAELIGQLPAD